MTRYNLVELSILFYRATLFVPSLPKIIFAVTGAIAYIVLMYLSARAPDAAARTVVLTVLAWQVFAVAILWSNGKRVLALLMTAPALLLFIYYDDLKHFEWLCLAPNVLVNASLFTLFARTLAGNKTALITQLALKVHSQMPGGLPAPIRAYTRVLTYVWSAFFLLSIAASLVLYFFVSFAAWSLFTNVFALPIILAVFVLEYVYRRLRFPWFEHVPIMAGVKAFTALAETPPPEVPNKSAKSASAASLP